MKSLKTTSKILLVLAALSLTAMGCERRATDASGSSASPGSSSSSSGGSGTMGSSGSGTSGSSSKGSK